MSSLTFVVPGGAHLSVEVRAVLNAGYAGRNQDQVRAHIDELAHLGVPAPSVTPTLYPVAAYLAQQTDVVQAQHARTSGEAEWALIIAGPSPRDILITAACDHTDRDLEVHGVAWSKNAGPDVLARQAWRLDDIADRLDRIEIIGRVGDDRAVIQHGTMGSLLSAHYWLGVLAERGLANTGTVLLSGTVGMTPDIDPFSDRWEVELVDRTTDRSIALSYRVEVLPAGIG